MSKMRATSVPVDRMSIPVEIIDRTTAVNMLLSGVLLADDAPSFKPANISADALMKIMRNVKGTPRNRTISTPVVDRYARDMAAGNWMWTGDPIKIDHDGFVRDGQHRLLAVVQADVKLPLAVVRDLDVEAQQVIDIGRPRAARDQAVLRGHPNAVNVTATAKLLLRWRSGRIMDSGFQPSIHEVISTVEGPDHDVIREGVLRAMAIRYQIPYTPITVTTTWFVEATAVDVELRDQIITQLIKGDGLTPGDPILALRNTCIRYAPARSGRGKHNQVSQLYQFVQAWNTKRKNGAVTILRVPSTLRSSTFPKLV